MGMSHGDENRLLYRRNKIRTLWGAGREMKLTKRWIVVGRLKILISKAKRKQGRGGTGMGGREARSARKGEGLDIFCVERDVKEDIYWKEWDEKPKKRRKKGC